MASAWRSSCSPLDIYMGNIDTSKVLVAKTFSKCLPDEAAFIPLIEDCCSNAVNSTYRHQDADQVAIILFQYPITDIRECQDELRKRISDVFIFEIESHPLGVVVINSHVFDSARLKSYIHNSRSGVGPDARPTVLGEGALLIVRVTRNREKVLRRVFSRSHTISGQSAYFQPYFPCFHDTLTELLNSEIPYAEADHRSHDRSYPPSNGVRDRSNSSRNGRRDRSNSPSNRRRDRSNSPSNGRLDRSYSPSNGRRDRSYSPSNGRRDRSYSPWNGMRGNSYSPENGRRVGSISPGSDRESRDRSYSPWNRGRDRSYSPGDGHCDRPYCPTEGKDIRSYSSGDSSRDAGRVDHDNSQGTTKFVRTQRLGADDYRDVTKHDDYRDVTKHDDINDDKKETIKIDASSICDDDEEKKIVSVCLKSPLGKRFLAQFQKDEGCKIDIKFQKKAIKQTRANSKSDTTSGSTERKLRSGAALKPSPRAIRNPLVTCQDPSLGLMIRVIDPTSPFDVSSLNIAGLDISGLDTVHIGQHRPGRQSRAHPVDRSDSVNINGTKLTIKKGDVTREKADVMVNVVGENLEFQESLISKAYAKKGGDELTQAYQAARHAYDGKGTIVCDGGKLSCNQLTTVVLAQRQDASSDQNFSMILESVFQKTTDLGLGTIVLPVMGCGKMLQFPLDVAVAITMDTTVKVLNGANNNLKEVTIVAFDDKTYDEVAKAMLPVGGTGTSPQKAKTTTSQPKASKETVGCSIELSAWGSRKVKRLRLELTKAIKEKFLSTNTVSIPACMSIRIKTKLYAIAEEHTKTLMKMEFDQFGVLLMGEMSQVSTTAKHIKNMLSHDVSSGIRKTLRCSPSSWYSLAHESPISPPYWSKFKANTPLTVLSKNSKGAAKRWSLVAVDAPTKKAVQDLVRTTWSDKLVGQGRDAVNLSHKRIKVDKVERIENIDVYSRYATKRHEHFRLLAEEGATTLKSLEKAHVQTKGAIATSPKDGSVLYDDIFPEINEYYLFHGTKPEVVQTVLQQGLDVRMSNEKAMFGMGIYGAETSTKADQYADSKQQRSPGSKTMLLVRMLLGNMFVCKDQNPTKYRKPPCRSTKCLRDNCTSGHDHFDSVVGDGHWLFREFVVYTAEQCLPEYLITYHRE